MGFAACVVHAFGFVALLVQAGPSVETNTDDAVAQLDGIDEMLAHRATKATSKFTGMENWCQSTRTQKAAMAKSRNWNADSIREAFVHVSTQLGQLKAEIEHKSKELDQKQDSLTKAQTRMQKEQAELETFRTETNSSVTTMTELLAVMEEKVSQEEAVAAVSGAFLSQSPEVNVLPKVRQALLGMRESLKMPSSGLAAVLGSIKAMREGLENDLAKAETDATTKAEEYVTLIKTLQDGISGLKVTLKALHEQNAEKETMYSQREQVHALVNAVQDSDRKQMFALNGFCLAAKHQDKSFTTAAAALRAKVAKAKRMLEKLPTLTNAASDGASFLQVRRLSRSRQSIKNSKHIFHEEQQSQHSNHHRHAETALNSPRGLSLALRGRLFRQRTASRPQHGRPKSGVTRSTVFVKAAARVLRDMAGQENSQALTRIATRTEGGTAKADIKMLVSLRTAIEKRRAGLESASVLNNQGVKDEAWCDDNRAELAAMQQDVENQEVAQGIRLARVRGLSAGTWLVNMLVADGALASGTSTSKAAVLDPLVSKLDKAEVEAGEGSGGDPGAAAAVDASRKAAASYFEHPRAPPAEASQAAVALDDAEGAAGHLEEVSKAAQKALTSKSEELTDALGSARGALDNARAILAKQKVATDADQIDAVNKQHEINAIKAQIAALDKEVTDDCEAALFQRTVTLTRVRLEEGAVELALRLLRDDRTA